MKPSAMLDLLRNADVAGLYSMTKRELPTAELAARQAGFNIWKLELAGIFSSEGLLEMAGQALGFPDWYGENWDALADCLADLSWSEAEGYVLILHDVQSLQLAAPRTCETLLEILRASSAVWHEDDIPFWALLDSPIEGAPTLSGKA